MIYLKSFVAGFAALIGYLLLLLGFQPAPILLGFVLGSRFEENFRRAMLISRGDLLVFVERPISAFFLFLIALLIGAQIYFRFRGGKSSIPIKPGWISPVEAPVEVKVPSDVRST